MAGVAGATSQGVRAGRAFVELFSKNDALYKGLNDAKRRLNQWAVGLAKTGAVVGGVGAAAAAPLAALLKQAAGRGDEAQRLADRFGTTTTAVQELSYAFEKGGMDLHEFGGFMDSLAAKVSAAADGNTELIEGLRGLNGRALINKSVPDQIDLIADKLASIVSEQDRVKHANDLGLGGMLPYLKDGAAGLARLKAEAAGVGAVLSPEEAKQGQAVMREWARLWREGTYTLMALGRALLPGADGVHSLADTVSGYLKQAREWVGNNKGVVLGVAAAAVGLVGLGVAFGVASAGASVLAAAVGLVGTVLGALFSPVGLIAAAVGGLGYLLFTQTEIGRGWAAGMGAYFEQTKKNALGTLDGLASAVGRGDLQAAWEIACAFVGVEWARLWAAAKGVWFDVLDWFGDGWDEAVKNLKVMWADLNEWMGKSMLGVMRMIWGQIKGAVNEMAILAATAAKIGGDDAAYENILRTNAMFQSGAVWHKVGEKLGEQGDGDRNAAWEELRATREARRTAKAGREEEADRDVADKQAELDELLGREKRKALDPAAWAKWGLGLPFQGGRDGGPAAPKIPDVAALQKGIFAGPVSQQLGYADQTAKRQLDAATETSANTKAIADKIGGFGPMQFK